MELAEPLLNEASNNDQRQIAIGVAVLAWNMAAIPESERWEEMNPESARILQGSSKAILEQLIARKLVLFPDESRWILDYEISGRDDSMEVNVVYSMRADEVSELDH